MRACRETPVRLRVFRVRALVNMRVIAGSLKGRRLKSPAWEGLRPTSDKLRETLFNVLGAADRRRARARRLRRHRRGGHRGAQPRRGACDVCRVAIAARRRSSRRTSRAAESRPAMLLSARLPRGPRRRFGAARRSCRSTSSCSTRRTTIRQAETLAGVGADAARAGRDGRARTCAPDDAARTARTPRCARAI